MTTLPVIKQRRSPQPVLDAVSAAAAGEAPPVRSLYVHVPFCFHKCHYCDFYSIVDRLDRQGPFVDRLERELAALAPATRGLPLHTVFFGGGTPSLLTPNLWARLGKNLRDNFAFDGHTEFTVECNPETVTPEVADALVAAGANRCSVGAQSFEPRHLKTLERWHEPASVPRALCTLTAAGVRRLSIDLIYAVPGQRPAEWRRDLETALALGTEHMSLYNLTYEPKTAMHARLRAGDFEPVEEDAEVQMWHLNDELTTAAGLRRYEVSNFAKPDAECRHNLAYWTQNGWLAAGPSAAGHLPAAAQGGFTAGGLRWKNTTRLDEYLAADCDGLPALAELEPPDPRRGVRELLMTGLRLHAGVAWEAVAAGLHAAGAEASISGLQAAADAFRRGGQLQPDTERLACTTGGLLFADGIAAELMSRV